MSAPRDVSPCFDGEVCRICGQPRTESGYDAHVEHHLATGDAVSVLDYKTTPRTWRVVPTSSMEVADDLGSIWSSDGDTYERNDPNSVALREAYAKARLGNRETKQRIAAAIRQSLKGRVA